MAHEHHELGDSSSSGELKIPLFSHPRAECIFRNLLPVNWSRAALPSLHAQLPSLGINETRPQSAYYWRAKTSR